ncbi:MAG TPA: FtsX-like permease family protein, partial [Puia sp.]|nr:FtsX-like permease family protein [Puia sp.]
IFGGYNNQIDIVDESNHAAEKRFKVEVGVFYTNPDFFDIFNFKWLSGNAQSVLSQPNQAALTKDVAEKYFGSWQNAIGKTFKKDNNELIQISGILENPPANTDFPFQIVISYITYAKSDNAKRVLNDWGSIGSRSQCFIKLPDENETPRIMNAMIGFRKKHLDAGNTTDFYTLQPLRDIHFNEHYGNFSLHTISKKTLLSLSLIGVFLLALACINFINLATAQAVKRSREVGIRKVLGSRRLQLGFQFLGETFVIVVAATILAIVLLTILSPLTEKIMSKPISMNPLHSPQILLFGVAIIFAVTFFSGFYPAIIVSGFKPIQALKNKITSNTSSGISLRRILVVLQFMIAQGLIIATLVIISQIKFFQSSQLGFNKDAIITVSLPRDSVSRTKWEAFRQELLQKPGVENVSLSFSTPASRSNNTTSFRFNQNIKEENFEINLKSGDAEYLKTYHLQLLAGRFYEASDTAREVLVNETLLKKERITDYKEALGKYIILGNVQLPIVGVVKDFHQSSLRDPIEPIVIQPFKNGYRIAGIKINPKNISATLSSVEQLFNKEFPAYLFEQNFLDETIEKFYVQEKQLSLLLKLFAAVGIFISCIGLYGLILFMTIQRIKEVGVRKILGASVSNIVMLFFKEFIWLITIAFVIASSVTWYFMNNWLNDFAYHTQISWWMVLAVGLASVLLAMITVSTQTIKAAIANPVKSLRTE